MSPIPLPPPRPRFAPLRPAPPFSPQVSTALSFFFLRTLAISYSYRSCLLIPPGRGRPSAQPSAGWLTPSQNQAACSWRRVAELVAVVCSPSAAGGGAQLETLVWTSAAWWLSRRGSEPSSSGGGAWGGRTCAGSWHQLAGSPFPAAACAALRRPTAEGGEVAARV